MTTNNKNKDTVKKSKSTTSCLNKFLITISIVFLVITILLTAVFIGFSSQSLLYFPWWRGLINNSGDPKTTFGIDYENIEFQAYDTNHTIRGWWVPASNENNANICVISIHGSGKDRYEWFHQIELYHQEGISVLNYDSIDGVGNSDGEERGVGYSYREHKDVRAAIRLLKNKQDDRFSSYCDKLILTGMSLGGGSVIIAAGKDKELIDGVIAESPYALATSAWRHNIFRFLDAGISSFFPFISSPYDEMLPKNPPEIIIQAILKITEYRIISGCVNISPQDTPLNWVGEISPKPILFIHATHDPVVPHGQSVLLFEAANQPKEMWTVFDKNTHQTAIHSTSPSLYRDKLRNFIKQL